MMPDAGTPLPRDKVKVEKSFCRREKVFCNECQYCCTVPFCSWNSRNGKDNAQSLYLVILGDYINTMKTTFGLNFGLNQAVKQHG